MGGPGRWLRAGRGRSGLLGLALGAAAGAPGGSDTAGSEAGSWRRPSAGRAESSGGCATGSGSCRGGSGRARRVSCPAAGPRGLGGAALPHGPPRPGRARPGAAYRRGPAGTAAARRGAAEQVCWEREHLGRVALIAGQRVPVNLLRNTTGRLERSALSHGFHWGRLGAAAGGREGGVRLRGELEALGQAAGTRGIPALPAALTLFQGRSSPAGSVCPSLPLLGEEVPAPCGQGASTGRSWHHLRPLDKDGRLWRPVARAVRPNRTRTPTALRGIWFGDCGGELCPRRAGGAGLGRGGLVERQGARLGWRCDSVRPAGRGSAFPRALSCAARDKSRQSWACCAPELREQTRRVLHDVRGCSGEQPSSFSSSSQGRPGAGTGRAAVPGVRGHGF